MSSKEWKLGAKIHHQLHKHGHGAACYRLLHKSPSTFCLYTITHCCLQSSVSFPATRIFNYGGLPSPSSLTILRCPQAGYIPHTRCSLSKRYLGHRRLSVRGSNRLQLDHVRSAFHDGVVAFPVAIGLLCTHGCVGLWSMSSMACGQCCP